MGVGLNPAKDSLAIEAKDSPYANVVAIRTGDNRPELKKLGGRPAFAGREEVP